MDKEIKDLSLKCASQYHMVNTLSGGNKQKVVFGKWIGADSRILILTVPPAASTSASRPPCTS